MVAACETIRFARAAAEMEQHSAPAAASDCLEEAARVLGPNGTLESVQDQDDWATVTSPVKVEKVTVGKFESFAMNRQVEETRDECGEECLNVRPRQPPGWLKCRACRRICHAQRLPPLSASDRPKTGNAGAWFSNFVHGWPWAGVCVFAFLHPFVRF